MGYYTDYKLKTDKNVGGVEFAAKFEEITGYQISDEGGGFVMDSVKWYEWAENMITISKLYPDVLFTLDGEGEEQGDIWKAYIKNGKMQYIEAKLTFDPYDESKFV